MPLRSLLAWVLRLLVRWARRFAGAASKAALLLLRCAVDRAPCRLGRVQRCALRGAPRRRSAGAGDEDFEGAPRPPPQRVNGAQTKEGGEGATTRGNSGGTRRRVCSRCGGGIRAHLLPLVASPARAAACAYRSRTGGREPLWLVVAVVVR